MPTLTISDPDCPDRSKIMPMIAHFLLSACYCIPYARHYNPLLIRNRSWILTIHKARILRKKPLEKTFLDFKKWVKSIQTAGYNGARTVYNIQAAASSGAHMVVRLILKKKNQIRIGSFLIGCWILCARLFFSNNSIHLHYLEIF